jgi:hypothetical protein
MLHLKLLRRAFTLILALALSLTFVPAELLPIARAASPFSDIAGHWAQSAIEELAGKGIINGMGDGTYNPNGTVTREQFMKLVVSVRGVSAGASTDVFYDLPEGSWANPFVAEGLSRNLFNLSETDDHYFAPGAPMDRDTVALWITRAVGLGGISESTPFADNSSIKNKSSVSVAVAEGLVTGYDDNTFKPQKTLTRAESAVLIQRLMNKDQKLNAPVVEHNDVVLREGVKKFEPSAGVNTLVSADEATGRYVFTNINDDIRNLQTDQIFIINPCSSVPEGIAIKVQNMKIDGDTAEILNAQISISDVFDKVDIAASTDISLADIDVSSIPDGVTVTNDLGQTIFQAKDSRKNGTVVADSALDKLPDGAKLTFSFDDLKLHNNIKISGKVSIVKPKVESIIDFQAFPWPNLKKAQATVEHGYEWDINVSFSNRGHVGKLGESVNGHALDWNDVFFQNGDYKKALNEVVAKQQIAEADIPVGHTGIFAKVVFYIGFTAEGEISISLSCSSLAKTGFKYEDGNFMQINEKQDSSDFSLEMEGKIKLGATVFAGFTLLGLADFGVEADIGIGLKAALDLINYNRNSGNLQLGSQDSYESGQLTEIHTDDICIDGDIYFYLDIGLSIKILGIIDLSPGKIEIFNEDNAKLCDFYISIIFQPASFDFGWGECPNIYKIPEITKQPVAQSVAAGKDVVLSVEAKNNSNKNKQSGDLTSGLSYDWYKDGIKLEGGIGDKKLSIGASSTGDAGEYYCVVYLTDYPNIGRTSNKVRLTVTAPDPAQIGADFSDKPVNSDPSSGNNGGEYNQIGADFSDKTVDSDPSSGNNGGEFDVILPVF